MATRFLSAIALIFLLAATGCRKDVIEPVNSDKLQQAVIAGNPDVVEVEINKVLSGLPAVPDSNNNLKNITDAISSQGKVSAVALCYNCIDTYPAQSEIKIAVAFAGGVKEKIIDISYSENKKYFFAGMHD